MYNKINKLKILDRKLTESDNYLTQEEYDKIIEFLTPDEDYVEFLEFLKDYCLPAKNEFRDENGNIYVPVEIKIARVRNDGYYNGDRDIQFTNSIYTINEYGSYSFENSEKTKEDRFRKEYLEKITQILTNISDKFDFVTKSSYTSYYNWYEIVVNRFINTYEAYKQSNELLEEIKVYYSSRIITIEKDEEFENTFKDLEDFLKTL